MNNLTHMEMVNLLIQPGVMILAGTLEVILGTIALNSNLITEQIFVAIVIMVIVSIHISAPLMKYSLSLGEKTKKSEELVA